MDLDVTDKGIEDINSLLLCSEFIINLSAISRILLFDRNILCIYYGKDDSDTISFDNHEEIDNILVKFKSGLDKHVIRRKLE